MAVETNARIEFSVASVEEWEKVNPKLHQGEPVFAKKPSGKYILKVGAPGGSTYKNAVVVWDQDDAETKMTSTQEAAAQALASKNAASASASAAKASENAAAASKSAAATSEVNAKTSETNAAASKASAANSASTASSNATASADSASAAATSERNAASSASAANTSENNALKSSNAAVISADKAKVSETNAAKSATAAAKSAVEAAKFDPTGFAKLTEIFPLTDKGRLSLQGRNITDLNDINCLAHPSWTCRDSAYTSTMSNCPTKIAFYLHNLRNGTSIGNDDTLPNLTSYWYYIVQILIDFGGNTWVRDCFNGAKEKFIFGAWRKIAFLADLPTKTSQLVNDSDFTTNDALAIALDDAKTEVKEEIPTKNSQLTNDSGFANTAALEAEAKKWKDAYNNLRKRSYPTEIDDDELTLLMDTQLATGTITLSQPYTDFDGLYIEYTDDALNAFNTKYISTAELNYRIARSIALKGGESGATISLISGEQYWRIWCGKSRGFTTTTFPVWAENCIIPRIYGVKFKEIT